jgi:crotonobetainyl-CoA:carnitine CoA-transferase CaiB-like acyl-CoA transferase
MCAPLQTVDEVFTDPQAIAREFFVQIENPEAGSLLQPSGPFKMSETPWKVRRPAPSLGQHTEEVLTQDLGLAADDVKSLRAESVI